MLLEAVKLREIENRLGVLSKLESYVMKGVLFVGNRVVFLAPTRVGRTCGTYVATCIKFRPGCLL